MQYHTSNRLNSFSIEKINFKKSYPYLWSHLNKKHQRRRTIQIERKCDSNKDKNYIKPLPMSINANTTRLPKSDFSKAKFMHSYICLFSIYFFTKNYALPDSIAIAEILYIVERNKYPRFEKFCHLFKKGKEIREREKRRNGERKRCIKV